MTILDFKIGDRVAMTIEGILTDVGGEASAHPAGTYRIRADDGSAIRCRPVVIQKVAAAAADAPGPEADDGDE